MSARFLAVLACLTALSVAGAETSSAESVAHPPGLTKAGVALWNFEALLRGTFGKRSVCVVTGGNANGSPLPDEGDYVSPPGGCSPEATYSTYGYTFVNPHGVAFHLVSRHFRGGAFGNYPVPVRVSHLYVACNAAATTYLIAYGDAVGGGFDCLRPG